MDKFGSVFFCDLDGLKKINDTYGHEIGDLAIQTEAQVLKAAFRENDLIGRLSGDEFGVVAPGFPSRKIDDLRKKFKDTVKLCAVLGGVENTTFAKKWEVHEAKLNKANEIKSQISISLIKASFSLTRINPLVAIVTFPKSNFFFKRVFDRVGVLVTDEFYAIVCCKNLCIGLVA